MRVYDTLARELKGRVNAQTTSDIDTKLEMEMILINGKNNNNKINNNNNKKKR